MGICGKNGLVGEGVRGDEECPAKGPDESEWGESLSMGDERPDEISGIINELEPGEERAEEGPAKAGRGGAASNEDEGPLGRRLLLDAFGVGIAIWEGRGVERFAMDREGGRQMWSPRDERGIESEQDEHLTLGNATDARSMFPGRTASMSCGLRSCER